MIIIGVLVVIVLILAIVNISFGSTSNRSNSNSSSNSSISSIFKHAPELFFRKRRNAGLLVWGGGNNTMLADVSKHYICSSTCDRQGQGPQIILVVRGMIIILV